MPSMGILIPCFLLQYAWSAQMINEFEGSNTRVLEGLTVRGPAMTTIMHFAPGSGQLAKKDF